MAKKRVASIAFLLSLCFLLFPLYAQAISTEEAKEPIVSDKECSLTLSYIFDGISFEDLSVNIYKIADISTDFQYILTPSFSKTGLVINGIKTNNEWNIIRSTFESHIISNGIKADYTETTDLNGKASFNQLKPGLFLVSSVSVTKESSVYNFKSALISVPTLDEDGLWKYDVSACPKASATPLGEEETQFKILKLWKGDKDKNIRPESIDVEILRNGVSYKTIVITDENNWSYVWKAKNDGSKWTVIEKNIPSEYILTIEEREHTFVLTNTFSEEPVPPPSTGDTSNIMFYIVMMIFSGCLLIITGVLWKRAGHEK